MPRWNYTSDEDRFWSKVSKTDYCWNWIASLDDHGYGQFWIRGATYPWKASRVAYMLSHGVYPGDKHVLHSCDNSKCVNPDHLFLGTHLENMQDMVNKGRSCKGRKGRSGVKNNNVKLTPENVLLMRSIYKSGECTQMELAEMFGIGQSQVSRIIRGEHWNEGY